MLSYSPRELVTLSDVTEANRKPSKRRRYNSVYLNLSKREIDKRRGEEERGREKRERDKEKKYEQEFVL